MKDKKILQVYVDPGMKNGQKIVFAGEADEAPGLEAGDIVFVVSERKHDLFKRNGNDLYMEQKIPLIEALAGFSFVFTHLDGRQILFKTTKGDVINPGDIRVLENEGMPTHKRPFEKGNLYIHFNIEFPKPNLFTPNQLDQLEKILPPRRPLPKVTEEMEQMELKPFSEKKGGRRTETYDDEEDDDGHPRGQRVQCAQQ